MKSAAQIILVEDNPADVFLVRYALEQQDFVFYLRVVSDGEQALGFLGEVERGVTPAPDIWLLDLNLPKYSGDQVIEKLRQSPLGSSAKVVVLTSSDSPKDRERVAQLGVAHYFLKPSDLDKFMKLGDVVRDAMEESGSARTHSETD
jgi:DNA-binding response OmpR family regulator